MHTFVVSESTHNASLSCSFVMVTMSGRRHYFRSVGVLALKGKEGEEEDE